MWLSRQVFEQMVEGRAKAEGATHAMQLQVQMQRATMDWMTLRLNQLEHERAVMMQTYMGVKIAVPEIQTEVPQHDRSPLNDSISFDDVGDEEAARQGLGWNDAGEFVAAAQGKA